jgi:glyoxylase-like metal-dependent hydrolase (beta-lactamase superfamily II)
MKNLTIRPINTGTMAISKSTLYHDSLYPVYNPPETQEETPVFCFLVEGGEKPLLVDTGMSGTDHAQRHHYPSAYQPEGMSVVDQLKKLGYAPEDIGYVVLTHLHWDHCYYLEHFSKARIFVHPTEIAFAADPLPLYYIAYEHPIVGIQSPYSGLHLEPVTEGEEVIPGVSVIETPGHSPGHISVCVAAATGEYICVGDAIMAHNNLKEVPELHYAVSPPGRATDFVSSWNSLKKLKSRAKSQDYLLLGHDKGMPERIKGSPVLR